VAPKARQSGLLSRKIRNGSCLHLYDVRPSSKTRGLVGRASYATQADFVGFLVSDAVYAGAYRITGLMTYDVQEDRSGNENEHDSEQEPFVRSLFQFDAMHGDVLAVWSISPATYARAPVENKQKDTRRVGNGLV
jgi:hypothetical protein